ncbi:MAG: glycosyltransferase family 9 protein [Proteobacteria bacterium]|nr:glycosyltransferase family 9 protein [Pseudomonadota bacterium]
MRKILAIKNRRLGDTALWTAALEALHDFTGNKIDIAYPAPYASLFDSDPRIDKQYHLAPNISSNLKLLKKIREVKYDAVLSFHASRQTEMFVRFSRGKKLLVHHHGRAARPNSLSKEIPNIGLPMSAIERDLNVVRGLGWNSQSPAPRLWVGPIYKSQGEQLLTPCLKSSMKKLAIHVGASRRSKQWSLEYFVSLTRLLGEQFEVIVLYDSPPTSLLWDCLEKSSHLIHTPDLPSLIGCLTWMDGFIGADSGVKHIAAALGIPTITLFGPESVGEWHGYDLKKHRAIQAPVGCRDQNLENPEYAWCGAEVCPLASHACMSQITPEQVAAEALAFFY